MSRQAEAETDNYASAAQKVNINAETTNGYIEVIK
jgi:predicted membrane protein